MTKEERINAFNEKYRIIRMELIIDGNRLALKRDLGMHAFYPAVSIMSVALTEAKEIMEGE